MSSSQKVWSKFTVTNKNGSVLNFRILEAGERRINEVVDLFKKYFATEESTMRAAGIPENQEAIEEVTAAYSYLTKNEPHHITICCLDNDEEVPEILGASIMVDTKHEACLRDLKLPIKTKQVQKLTELVGYMMIKTQELISNQKVDRYFDDKGVVVHPDYRRLGIARELLEVRRLVCKDRGIPLTCAWMTAYSTQKGAERDGWETGFEVDYDEFGRLHGVTFTNVPPNCKLMFARITN